MRSFVTQHNAKDVSSFEGACNWHADCRNFHQDLDLTEVPRHNQHQWANAPLQWRLTRWGSVFFMDESRRVRERFAGVNVANSVPNGGGVVMVWAGISFEQQTQLCLLSMAI